MDAKDNENILRLIKKINKFRESLLDLTRRNPLLYLKMSTPNRGDNVIRLINSTPEKIFELLTSNKEIQILPLPPTNEDQIDEESTEFKDAYSEALETDPEYLLDIKNINESEEKGLDQLSEIERRLKDRVRQKLNLPPRTTQMGRLDNTTHARNNYICPEFDLSNYTPLKQKNNSTEFQTLMMPGQLEDLMRKIMRKTRTLIDEAGINSLFMAFGFLEWENNEGEFHSPLLLIPVKILEKESATGAIYKVVTDEDSLQVNTVLAKKLKEIMVALPNFEDHGIKKYFSLIEKSKKPTNMKKWQLKQYVAIGNFPSAKLSMYEDLDPKYEDLNPNIGLDLKHKILNDLLLGTPHTDDPTNLNADKNNVDNLAIETKLDHLIYDADSSQLSAIWDVASGKNLALEGPPGTGKSQTIVNVIANTIYSGKTVLFVAEKVAALDIVKSRLDAKNLGEFLLPIIANQSHKSEVFDRIRKRINLNIEFASAISSTEQLKNNMDLLQKSRKELQNYYIELSKKYLESDFSQYEVLWETIKRRDILDILPREIRDIQLANSSNITKALINDLETQCDKISEIAQKVSESPWMDLKIPARNMNASEEIIRIIEDATNSCDELIQTREKLNQYFISPNTSIEKINNLHSLISTISESVSEKELSLCLKLNCETKIKQVKNFLDALNVYNQIKGILIDHIKGDIDRKTLNSLSRILEIMKSGNLHSLENDSLESFIKRNLEIINCYYEVIKAHSLINPTSSDVRLEYNLIEIIDALMLLVEISDDALLLRRKEIDSFEHKILIKKLIKRGKELQSITNSLSEELDLSLVPSNEELLNHLDVLKKDRFFETFLTFDKNYRKANSFLALISKGSNRITKTEGIKILTKLINWLEERKKYEQESLFMQDIFPSFFDGVYTKFKDLEEVIGWYEKIDSTIKKTTLKDFLKNESPTRIKSLYFTIDKEILHKFKSYNMEADLKRYGTEGCKLIDELSNLISIFAESEGITYEKLNLLEQQLNALLEHEKRLKEDPHVEEALRYACGSTRIDVNTIERCILISSRINELELNEKAIATLFHSGVNHSTKDFRALVSNINQNQKSLEQILSKLGDLTGINYFNQTLEYNELLDRLRRAKNDIEGLNIRSDMIKEISKIDQELYREAVQKITDFNPAMLKPILLALVFNEMAKQIFSIPGLILEEFTGQDLEQIRNNFQEADRNVIAQSQANIRTKLIIHGKEKIYSSVSVSNASEYKKLLHEANKKKRHLPLRKLLSFAWQNLQVLTPCWMMSPTAIAQYLPNSREISFDLVIIDEASQMPPADALGALIRAKQCMIVGDVNQLPPTNFFHQTNHDDSDDDTSYDQESILKMANASFYPPKKLMWHYRSKDPKLINFSNKHIYDNSLVLFPSAKKDASTMGVRYVKVNGLYKAGINPIEAKEIVKWIIEFMRENGDKRSLGVVLLNQKQRDLIEDEMRHAERDYPHILEFIRTWREKNGGLESFFIKNLENVQGDERDVICIGTVYGPEIEGGSVLQRFGPINSDSGRRRLNVLFTRAKEQIITFSSMTSADVIVADKNITGAGLLKSWLEYSKTGILEQGIGGNAEHDSPFEESIFNTLKSLGCIPTAQVGVNGFYIDIGVEHPAWPHGYIMGVECDGASYHSSKSARDRDRLRQQVLEDLGWHIYRIWSTSWFQDPKKETEKLKSAIENRLKELNLRNDHG